MMMMATASQRSARKPSGPRSTSGSGSRPKPKPVSTYRLPKELDILPPRPVLFPWLPSVDVFGCCWGGGTGLQLAAEEAAEEEVNELRYPLDEIDGESTCSSSSNSRSSNSRSRSIRSYQPEPKQPPKPTKRTRARQIIALSKSKSKSKTIESKPSTQSVPARKAPVWARDTSLTVEILRNMSDLSTRSISSRSVDFPLPKPKFNEVASSSARTATTRTTTTIDDVDESISSVPDMSSIHEDSDLDSYHSTISSSPTYPWDESLAKTSSLLSTQDSFVQEPTAKTSYHNSATTQKCHKAPLISLTDVISMVLQVILQLLSVKRFLLGDHRKLNQDGNVRFFLEDDREQHQDSHRGRIQNLDSHHGRIPVDSVHQRDNYEHW